MMIEYKIIAFINDKLQNKKRQLILALFLWLIFFGYNVFKWNCLLKRERLHLKYITQQNNLKALKKLTKARMMNIIWWFELSHAFFIKYSNLAKQFVTCIAICLSLSIYFSIS